MAYPIIQLKAGREASVGFRHPWIFSGALETVPDGLTAGDFVHIADRNGRIIATESYEGAANIAVRVFDFSETIIDEAWISNALALAHSRRLLLGYGQDTDTTGYRFVFSEADNLPGLVIDRYADVLVLQVSTVGMRTLLPIVIEACKNLFQPNAIVDKSGEVAEMLYGSVDGPVNFVEHGMKFAADVVGGQKTGFYLDQKDLRQHVRKYANGKNVLNLFSYTGATSIAALLGGAADVHNVDESEAALAQCAIHTEMNGIAAEKSTTEQADVFSWLNDNKDPAYDMVILDPPALTKTKKEKEAAAKAYHFLNRAALRLVKNDGIFVTSSCSHYFTEDDLAFTLRRASVQAGVELDVLHVIRQAPDHPLSVYWPEGLYLKSFICRVRRI
ncbi:MAG: hypothetical protein A3C02_01505 [Candidatus Andersenbacteria bacterium RIFCSPHIGHO2_02_FULL_45_11]|uniref:PUA domain-containing protein n=1 Tax=Candidatus Andersenbacteria bacterium RIFCSPHIGHO2_12_FULL_45_11 TaxID=1797281 RepID=A0A1G1X350_9BACT|nr:MAG: hypothetical protein A2805_01180 [Candidatus Andersenbacteria bacterium RIFCSPHIGHO2_01_FULL_46_36]OGY34403.1 MAG: hypothetical protein A3D99_02725 [Candidatus Andersenbacteria bacterium RIFCSPHIGHO2_12_FULL_45_11]OGY34979.1 MAG: hypothetical protein A3C02_01505 [Candidatus Andersenbacteria bacterium RIFCSPHIGHO2_02_FULL_45_11]